MTLIKKDEAVEVHLEDEPADLSGDYFVPKQRAKRALQITVAPNNGNGLAKGTKKEAKRTDEKEDWPNVSKQSGMPDGRAMANVVWFCKRNGIQARYNEFDRRTYVVIDDPEKTAEEAVKDQREVDDPVIREVQYRMNIAKCVPTASAVEAGLKWLGEKNKYHPVREYLDGLEWDGVARLEQLLPKYLRTEDTGLNRAFGKAWMIAAVRRVREPGCKADAVLTLQSP
jgi:hypothetical protein